MANDLWRTPPEVFNNLDREFVFLADTACTYENKLCPVGFTEENDSLSDPWLQRLKNSYPFIGSNAYVWCNPPYSDISPWVDKAIEAQLDGLGVVMLLNQDTSVGWFYKALKYVSEIRFITGSEKESGGFSGGRLAFIDENGKPASGNNKPQFILVFNPFKVGANITSYVTKAELMKSERQSSKAD